MELELEIQSSIHIQRVFRGYQSRVSYHHIQNQILKIQRWTRTRLHEVHRCSSARLTLQCWTRGCLARNVTRQLRLDERQNQAAKCIVQNIRVVIQRKRDKAQRVLREAALEAAWVRRLLVYSICDFSLISLILILRY